MYQFNISIYFAELFTVVADMLRQVDVLLTNISWCGSVGRRRHPCMGILQGRQKCALGEAGDKTVAGKQMYRPQTW